MNHIEALRAALTDRFLAKKPSFERFQKRAAKAGYTDITRDDYDVIMRDVRKLMHLFKTSDVDPNDVICDRFVINSWGNPDNPNFQVKAHLRHKNSKLERAKPRKQKFKTSLRQPEQLWDIMYIPDLHIGYFLQDDHLEPLHDEQAIECMWLVADYFQPKTIVILGDFLDLAGYSSFENEPGYRNKVQCALQAAYDYLLTLRTRCPDARIIFIEGNHEHRISKYLSRLSPEAHGIKRVGDEQAVMSIPFLLRLDELNIEYSGPYGTHLWIEIPSTGEDVRTMHGDEIGRVGGETAAKLLTKYHENTVCGHIHRAELAFKTISTKNGPRRIWSMSCGTGARLDGKVPGPKYPDWMHAVGNVWAGGEPGVHTIVNGVTHISGVEFRAEAK